MLDAMMDAHGEPIGVTPRLVKNSVHMLKNVSWTCKTCSAMVLKINVKWEQPMLLRLQF